MRDYLFRGKRRDNGEWVEGGLISVNDCEHGTVTAIIPHNCEAYRFNISGEYVIPETVGQYTGMTDKNGKKIFEGDILNTTNSNCAIWYVDYKNTAFCCNQGNTNYSCVLDEFMQFSVVEVIGNIYDNKEILDVK